MAENEPQLPLGDAGTQTPPADAAGKPPAQDTSQQSPPLPDQLEAVEISLDVPPGTPAAEQQPAAADGEAAEGADGKEVAEAQEHQPRRPGRPKKETPQERINDAIKKWRVEQREKNALAEQNQQLVAKLRETHGQLVQTNHAAMHHYGAALDAQLKSAKQALKEAEISNDADAKVEAQTNLARVAADMSAVDAWKQQNPTPQKVAPQPQNQPQRQTQQPQNQPQMPQEMREWVDDRPWFNPEAPEYDEEMHDDAVLVARRIERQFQRENRGREIGRSGAYFSAIDNEMKKMYDDYAVPGEQPRQPRTNSPNRTVASPSGNGLSSSNENPQVQRHGKTVTVRLTSDQRQLAHSLTLKHPNGNPMSSAEKEKEYAMQLAGMKPGGVGINVRLRGNN